MCKNYVMMKENSFIQAKLKATGERIEEGGIITRIYDLENFNVSPFSSTQVVTQDTDEHHRSVKLYFRLPISFKGTTSKHSVHLYYFAMDLERISTSTSKSELTYYITGELRDYSEKCKIPTLKYLGYDTPTSSRYAQTIENYIQRKYSYKPMMKFKGRARKKQTGIIQTSSNCDCFFERYLPQNFVIPRADAKITEEIHCKEIIDATNNELKRKYSVA